VVVVAAAVALVAGAADDVGAHHRLAIAQGRAQDTTATLAAASARQAALTRLVEHTVSERNTTRVDLNAATVDLASTRLALQQAGVGSALLHLDIGSLSTCLTGVSHALDAVRIGNTPAATAALSSVSTVCLRLVGSNAGGAVYPFDFADPFLLPVGAATFAFGTNSASGNVQVLRSTDLTSWKPVGDALPRLPTWAVPGATWAPAVMRVGSRYELFYAVAEQGSRQSCLSVASSSQPQGPYTDKSKQPLVCQSGGSIDPYPYSDANGRLFLAWRGQTAAGGRSQIWAQALDEAGTGFTKQPAQVLLSPSLTWEANVVEAPAMAYMAGTYWLLYSGNDWDTASYALGAARCAGPMGPCTKVGTEPIYGSKSNLLGPGSASWFTDPDGHPAVAFHAWLPGAVGYPHARLLFIRRVSVSATAIAILPPGPG
jgi:Glycosyl hydrolases family 43